MSLDVFLQGCRNGDSANGDGAEVRKVLGPFIVESGDTWANVATADGSAEAYGLDELLKEADIEHLPTSLVENAGVVVLTTGADLLQLVENG